MNYLSKIAMSILIFSFLSSCSKSFKHVVNDDKNSLDSIIIAAKESKADVVISKRYNLNGESIDISNLSVIFKEGGTLENAIIKCNNCKVISKQNSAFLRKSILSGNSNMAVFYLSWFIERGSEDGEINFFHLSNLVDINSAIILDRFFSLKTKFNTQTFSTNYTIRISGVDKNKCGLVLLTKHKLFTNYFQFDKGNNLDIKNITITTEDFLAGIRGDIRNQYYFSGSYFQEQYNPNARPGIEFVTVDNCIINGAVTIAGYGSSSLNQNLKEFRTSNKIKGLKITNSSFESVVTPFYFSNMGYDLIEISNNKIYNLASAFLSIPASGLEEEFHNVLLTNRNDVIIEKNHFFNDIVVELKEDGTLTPCVIKGGDGDFTFRDNIVENLLSKGEGGNVNTFYYSSTPNGRTLVEKNVFRNVIGYGGLSRPASIVKQRGAANFTLYNNKFLIEKTALVKIGALKSIDDNLSTLDGTNFLCEFIQSGGFYGFVKKYDIKDNIFSIPYINLSSEIFDVANLIFENNTLNIEYFGTSKKDFSVYEDGVMFLARQRIQRDEINMSQDLIFKKNKISIFSSAIKDIKWIYNREGTQSGDLNNTDIIYNFGKVYIDDTFEANDLSLSYDLSDAIEQVYKPVIIGKNSSISFRHRAAVGHNRMDAKMLNTEILIDNYSEPAEGSLFTINIPSTQKVKIGSSSTPEIRLLSYGYLSSIYPLRNYDYCLLEFRLSYVSNSKKITRKWNIGLDNINRNFKVLDDKYGISVIYPSSSQGKRTKIFSRESINSELVLVNGFATEKDAYIKLVNMLNAKSIDITLNIKEAALLELETILIDK